MHYKYRIKSIIDNILYLNTENEHKVDIVLCSESENRHNQGIHLFEPGESEIIDAYFEAQKDLFFKVYVHYSNVIRFKRKAA